MDAREVIERELRRMIADGESHLMGARHVLSALDAAGFVIEPKEPTLEPHNDPGITGYRLPIEPQEDGELITDLLEESVNLDTYQAALVIAAAQQLKSLRSEVERLGREKGYLMENIASLEMARDSAIRAHDDMKDCLLGKLKEAIAERDSLREALGKVHGISYPHPSRNFDTMIADMGMMNDICRSALSPPQFAPSGEKPTDSQDRPADWHYDSQGYCDNPGRGY